MIVLTIEWRGEGVVEIGASGRIGNRREDIPVVLQRLPVGIHQLPGIVRRQIYPRHVPDADQILVEDGSIELPLVGAEDRPVASQHIGQQSNGNHEVDEKKSRDGKPVLSVLALDHRPVAFRLMGPGVVCGVCRSGMYDRG